MSKHSINPPSLYDGAALGLAQGIVDEERGLLFVSGQVDWDRQQQVSHDSAAEQFKSALDKLEAVLDAAKAGIDDILHLRIYVRGDLEDHMTDLAPILAGFLGTSPAAVTGIGVASLATKATLVEVEATVGVGQPMGNGSKQDGIRSSGQGETMLLAALDALKRGDVQPWVDMFADDGVMEFPYAPAGYPHCLDGKAAIAGYMAHYPEHVTIREVLPTAFHGCGDVIVAEFSCEATVVATGKPFRMDYVGIITMHDGKIARYRDYWNPLTALQAMGGAEALLALGGSEGAA